MCIAIAFLNCYKYLAWVKDKNGSAHVYIVYYSTLACRTHIAINLPYLDVQRALLFCTISWLGLQKQDLPLNNLSILFLPPKESYRVNTRELEYSSLFPLSSLEPKTSNIYYLYSRTWVLKFNVWSIHKIHQMKLSFCREGYPQIGKSCDNKY